MKNQISYSPEVRERAVRLVFEQQKEHESQWAAIKSIASKIGCTAETLRTWVRRTEIDQGIRGGLSTADRERLKELEQENRELKRANEILRKASAYFAQAEHDRRPKCWRPLSIATKQNMGSSQSAMKSGLPRRATTNTKHASEIPIDCLTASSGT